MRAQDSRKLSAMGFRVGERIQIAGLETTRLRDSKDQELLLVSPKLTGPSWPQVYQELIDFGPLLKIMGAGEKPMIIVLDSFAVRQTLSQLSLAAKASRVGEVFLEDIGFSSIDQKSRFDLRNLLFPAVSVAVVITIGVAFGVQPSAVNNQEVSSVDEPRTNDSCVIDLPEKEFRAWLVAAARAQAPLAVGVSIKQSTELGLLDVTVDTVLGSAAKIAGSVTCSDGRNRSVNHRLDTSGSGAVLELPN